MENEKKDVIEKIRKLLELANHNPNESEALQAALKAQALMAEHDIVEEELGDGSCEPDHVVTAESSRDWKRAVMRDLADTVADNFRCKSYFSYNYRTYSVGIGNRHRRKTSGDVMKFVGYETDANAAALTFDYLARTLDRNARKAARDAREKWGYADGVYNSYAYGFIAGVREVLEKQCKSLMLVRPKAVDEKFAELSFAKGGSRSAKTDNLNSTDYSRGKDDGRDAVTSRRVQGSLALTA